MNKPDQQRRTFLSHGSKSSVPAPSWVLAARWPLPQERQPSFHRRRP
ncbi:hypothetical protein [Pseudomonas graminis]